jgi:hypothetical protein
MGTAVNNSQDVAQFPPVSMLSNEDLWQMILTPTNHATREVKEYFKRAEREFSKRDIKLEPIMACK